MRKEKIELVLHTKFNLAHIENIRNVAMSLAMSGYFVNIERNFEETGYILKIYSFKN